MKVAIGCDHGGFQLKTAIIDHLKAKEYEVIDVGTYDTKSCHYPEIAQKVASAVTDGSVERGILCCGTGIGMSIAVNKVDGIRGAVVSDNFSALYTRLHNDTNVLCLGERTIGVGLALMLTDTFLETPFEGGRHQIRVDMITKMEGGNV